MLVELLPSLRRSLFSCATPISRNFTEALKEWRLLLVNVNDFLAHNANAGFLLDSVILINVKTYKKI